MDNDLELFKQWMQTVHMQRAFEEWKASRMSQFDRDWASGTFQFGDDMRAAKGYNARVFEPNFPTNTMKPFM